MDGDDVENEGLGNAMLQDEQDEPEVDLGIQEINDDDESQDIFDNFEKNQI